VSESASAASHGTVRRLKEREREREGEREGEKGEEDEERGYIYIYIYHYIEHVRASRPSPLAHTVAQLGAEGMRQNKPALKMLFRVLPFALLPVSATFPAVRS
jgi:hypothetical protein